MKTQISTQKAPGAIGPYSQAIDTGSFVFIQDRFPLIQKPAKFPKGLPLRPPSRLPM